MDDLSAAGEIATVKLRYKEPDGDLSRLLKTTVRDGGASLADASEDLRFASAVAMFGLVLHGSDHAGAATLSMARELAEDGLGRDAGGFRAGFLRLVDRARELRGDAPVPVTTAAITP